MKIIGSSPLTTLPPTVCITIGQKKDKVEFECKSKTENDMTETEIKDKIEFKVSAKKDGLKVKVEYETEVETATEETETETGYELVFDRIIEYRKIGGDDMSMTTTNTTTNTTTVLFEDDAYEWDVDEVVQEWPLDDFDDFSSVTEEGNLNKFSVATKDGIATFFFTIARADTADITANKMKIDFELLDFPWNSTDTHVALVCDVETTQKVEVEYEDEDDDEEDDEDNDADRKLLRQLKKSDEEKEKKKKAPKDIKISFDDAANAVGFVPFGSYTWRKEALAEVPADSVAISRQSGGDDGEVAAGGDHMFQTINVVATTSPAEDSTMLAFSFVGDGAQLAPDIYWDPEAGVGYEEAAAAGGGSKSGGVSSTTMMMSTDMIGMLAGGMISAMMLASVWM